MLRFVLANPYALRTCMRLSSLKYELDMQVYPIHACPHHSFVKFTRKCVKGEYSLKWVPTTKGCGT